MKIGLFFVYLILFFIYLFLLFDRYSQNNFISACAYAFGAGVFWASGLWVLGEK